MTDHNHHPDPLDTLSDLRPDATTLVREWPAAERAALLHRLLDDDATARPPRFVTRSRSPRRFAVPVAAVALSVSIAGALVAVMPSGDGDDGNGLPPLGQPFTASEIEQTPRVGPGQFSYRATTTYKTDGHRLVATQTMQDWAAPNGDLWSLRGGGERTRTKAQCFRFEDGTVPQRSLDTLPTDAGELAAHLRGTVSGSSSREEAVFVNVGDTLRDSDLLATSQLRAAYVEVLSRTGGVAVHRGVTDSRGRATVRADFLDPNNRPGQLSSLYFDADTFQLLGESASKVRPTAYNSQSYDKAPPAATTPVDLPAPTTLTVVTSEKVVDSVPSTLAGCPVS